MIKNILLVAGDVQMAKDFYNEILGLQVIRDFGEKIMMTDGIVLQDKKTWELLTGKSVSNDPSHSFELYFEENNFEEFINKLKNSKWNLTFINAPYEDTIGRMVTRFYDLDNHIIEVAETPIATAKRHLKGGMSVDEVLDKTFLARDFIQSVADALKRQKTTDLN